MGRAVVRGDAGLTAALAASALVLAGCSGVDPAKFPTSVDYERAQRVLSDPWLSPSHGEITESSTNPEAVDRHVGGRSTRYVARDPAAVARREIEAARAAGWRLTGVECPPPSHGERVVEASLARGTGIEDGVVAVLRVEHDGAGRETRAQVDGYAAHHLDREWPAVAAPALAPARSCLRGGPGQPLPEDIEDGRVPEGEEPERTEWSRESLDDGERALVGEVNADPWVSALGLAVPERLEGADWKQVRAAPSATVRVSRPPAQVARGMGAWEVTWVACGHGRSTELSARLETGHGVAVARLSGIGARTEITVGVPLPEIPPPAWISEVPALDSPPCLAGPERTPLVTEGTPVALVTASQPVTG